MDHQTLAGRVTEDWIYPANAIGTGQADLYKAIRTGAARPCTRYTTTYWNAVGRYVATYAFSSCDEFVRADMERVVEQSLALMTRL